jgi:hypothetical protein
MQGTLVNKTTSIGAPQQREYINLGSVCFKIKDEIWFHKMFQLI